MNARVMDTADNITSWFGRLAAAIHCGFVCTGRARAAAELARLGYYEEARKIMLEDQEDS
jgi:hypothetical protein